MTQSLSSLLVATAIVLQSYGKPVLRIAYFVPSDRQPCVNFSNRLDTVIQDVQAFYRKGMEMHGFGTVSFTPDRNPDGSLRIIFVRGLHPMRHYGRNDSQKVRSEVKDAFKKEGLDMDRETVVLFQVLLEWQGDKAVEVGPYCGSGDHRHGTAWVYDDERLDARKLGDTSPGGYYHGHCSIGKFNSHYVGGVAHELGHALGLPHDCQAAKDPRGSSLMGGGNHTYGREKRKEGLGSFLSAASAMPLARHPLFSGDQANLDAKASSKLLDLQSDFKEGVLLLSGRLAATPAAYGVVTYNDWSNIRDDYDALGVTSPLGKDGAFHFTLPELKPGHWQLRLRVCHGQGGRSALAFDYDVSAEGKPDLSAFRELWQLGEAVKARASGDIPSAEQTLVLLDKRAPSNSVLARKIVHLRSLLKPAAPQKLSSIPAGLKEIPLSDVTFAKAQTGWGPPLRNEVMSEEGRSCFLEVNGQFFEKGLYAHAPASHLIELEKSWKRFCSSFGLQDGHGGSVVFVIKGDGKELFRSPLIQARTLERVTLDVTGVSTLELLTENGGDGSSSDWAVWLMPTLSR